MQMDALQRLLRALADGLRGRAAEDPLRALASGLYGRATEASEAGGGSFDSGLDGVLDLLDHGEPVLAFEISTHTMPGPHGRSGIGDTVHG